MRRKLRVISRAKAFYKDINKFFVNGISFKYMRRIMVNMDLREKK
jgi:hypothetical protein